MNTIGAEMDLTNRQIIGCLKENARMSVSAIAEKVSLSVPAVSERIRKLETEGYIRGYSVILGREAEGNSLLAFIMVAVADPQSCEELIAFAKGNDSILECHYVTGQEDFLLKVSVPDSHELEKVIRSVKRIKGVSATKTQVVLSTSKTVLS